MNHSTKPLLVRPVGRPLFLQPHWLAPKPRAGSTTKTRACLTLGAGVAALALALLLALTVVNPAFAQEGEPAVLGAAGGTNAAGLVEPGGANLSMRKLVIGSFTVAFATHHARRARQESGLGSSASQTLEFNLEGLDAATMQRATDQAYEAFVKAAKAQGYTVVERQDLVAHPSYQGVVSAGKPSGLVREAAGLKSVFVAPSGMALSGIGLMALGNEYTPNALAGAGGALGTLGALTSMASVIGNTTDAVGSAKPLAAVSAAFGDSTVVSVRLAVFFAELKSEFGSRASAILSAGVNSKLGLYVDPQNTMVTAWQPSEDKTRNFILKKPLMVDGNPFREVVDDSPTGQNVGVAVLGALMGGRTSSKTNRYKVVVEPQPFGELATQVLVRAAPVVLSAFGAPSAP